MATPDRKRTRRRLPAGIYSRGPDNFYAVIRLRGFPTSSRTFTTAAAAIDWSAATRKELAAARKRGARCDVAQLTVGGLVNEYLADPVTLKRRSFDTIHDRADWWVAQYGATKILDLGVLDLREARAKLGKARGPATCNRYLAVMRRVWNWGRGAGLVPLDRNWPGELMQPEPRGRTRFLSDDELAALLRAAAVRGPIEHAMVVVSIACGLRQGELLRLTWRDVDLDRARVTVRLSKTGDARTVHLPSTAVDALRAIRASGVVGARHVFIDRRGKPYGKDALHQPWNVIRAAAGLEDFHWHDLRHTCASILAQQGSTLLEIGSVLGHRSPSMTMRYAHLVQGAPVTGHAGLDAKLRGA